MTTVQQNPEAMSNRNDEAIVALRGDVDCSGIKRGCTRRPSVIQQRQCTPLLLLINYSSGKDMSGSISQEALLK